MSSEAREFSYDAQQPLKGPRVLEAASPALSKMDELTGLRGPTIKESGAPVGPCAWSPGDGVAKLLKKSPLQNPLDEAQYHIHILHRASGVRVERHWDRDIAYLDVLRFSAGARIPYGEWALGDALERCFAAHQAIAPGRNTASTPEFYYIHHLEVLQAARNKGIGRGLLNQVMVRIREDSPGTPWVWLCANGSRMDDEPLIRWYEKSGFRRISPVTTIMYFDNNFTKRSKIDPTVDAAVPYVIKS